MYEIETLEKREKQQKELEKYSRPFASGETRSPRMKNSADDYHI